MLKNNPGQQPNKEPAGLTEASLRQLVTGGVVTAVRVKRREDATYGVFVEMGVGQAQLLNTRGLPRTFSSLDTAAAAVERLGISEFTTNLTSPDTQ